MKRKQGGDLIFLLVVAIFTAVLWVGFETYRTLNRPATPTGLEELLTPLTVSLKLDVFNQLESKQP